MSVTLMACSMNAVVPAICWALPPWPITSKNCGVVPAICVHARPLSAVFHPLVWARLVRSSKTSAVAGFPIVLDALEDTAALPTLFVAVSVTRRYPPLSPAWTV